jgi:hypothetical protein
MRKRLIYGLVLLMIVASPFVIASFGDDKKPAHSAPVNCTQIQHDLTNAVARYNSELQKSDNFDIGTKEKKQADAKAESANAEAVRLNQALLKNNCGTNHVAKGGVACDNSWNMNSPAPKTGFRVVGKGVPSIQLAFNSEQARKGAYDWLDEVKTDPDLLSAVAAKILNNKPVSPAVLSKNGCATQQAKLLFGEAKTALVLAKITPDQAPSNGYNSSTDAAGRFVMASSPGIGGNRKAVKIVTRDGVTIWVMARCGNIVKPPPPPPPVCPPGQHMSTVPPKVCITPKDPSKDVLLNPDVPDKVKGPGTTPVGTDPGPATPVYDTPTGCNGPCPTPAPTAQPSPNQSSAPPPDTTPVSSQTPNPGASASQPPPPPSD